MQNPNLFSTETHSVFNQPTALEPYSLWNTDLVLQKALARGNGAWGQSQIEIFDEKVGTLFWEWGRQANQSLPILRTHDRYGHRVDQIDFHPAYHQLMKTAIEAEMHSLPWTHRKTGAHVVRASMMYLHHQVEQGTCCPLTMTHASIPTLRKQPALADYWEKKILAPHYDPSNVPFFEKKGCTIGMAMTEKQGGTDVRSNTTQATRIGSSALGEEFELLGHKWFCSAPMCDAFLTLAKTNKGISCFLLPRWRPDGNKNAFFIQQLKNKLGNVSNASSEVEFRGAFAWLVGEEGRGIANIIEMVSMTRFDCIVGSASLMRQALVQAIHHTSHREVMGKKLIEQPLMKNVLADLSIESEASLRLAMRVAESLDNASSDASEKSFARIATAIGKYWVCKRVVGFVNEAQECLGGAGYVEESGFPRLYKEAPLNSIWEGSGNVQCLDVLRAISKEPETLTSFVVECSKNLGKNEHYDQAFEKWQEQIRQPQDEMEFQARNCVERMALLLQASLLLERSETSVAKAFCTSRLSENRGFLYGCLPVETDCQEILCNAFGAK